MIRIVLLACTSIVLLAGVGMGLQQEVASGDTAVSVSQRVARVRPFVGEVVPVEVRLEIDREVAATQWIALFRRPLDLPIQVDIPWLEGGEGWSARPLAAADGTRIAVGGEEYLATEIAATRDGRAIRVLSVRAEFIADVPGELRLAAPRARWAWTSAFEEDLFGTRRPVDRQEASSGGTPLLLDVRALPEAGRPEDYGGAVGRFEVSARLDREVVNPGETLELVLRFTGDGALHAFEPPRLDGLAGFDVLGRLERPAPDARVVVYALSPRVSGAVEVPSVVFPYFDPSGDGAWRQARSEPLPVTVRGAAAAPSDDGLPPLLPLQAMTPRDAARPAPSAPLWGGVLLPWVVGAVVWLRNSARRRAALPAARVRRAARRLRRGLLAGGDPRSLLEACAAELLNAPVASAVDPRLEQRLCACGVRGPEARALAALHRGLLDAAYGGPAVEEAREQARRLAEALLRGPRAGGRQ